MYYWYKRCVIRHKLTRCFPNKDTRFQSTISLLKPRSQIIKSHCVKLLNLIPKISFFSASQGIVKLIRCFAAIGDDCASNYECYQADDYENNSPIKSVICNSNICTCANNYTLSENKCVSAGKWKAIYLICILCKTRKLIIICLENTFRFYSLLFANSYLMHFIFVGSSFITSLSTIVPVTVLIYFSWDAKYNFFEETHAFDKSLQFKSWIFNDYNIMHARKT